MPKGIGGLIITAANFIAFRNNAGDTEEALIGAILSRPHFLKHQAIRVITAEVLRAIFAELHGSSLATGTRNG